ncbi:MAG: Tfp pilus assembly protein FimT/FimU [Verrucomicrobiales bacterium]
MKGHPPNSHLSGGFSLVELLIVMAIAGALLVLAASSGDGWGEQAAQRGAISQVASALDRARAHAIANDGYAAFVVAGPEAQEKAWRQVAVVAVRELPAGGDFPYELADASDTPGVEAPADPIDLVMPWMDLPKGLILFGRAHGAPVESMVDDTAALKVPTLKNGPLTGCKVIVFNGQGAVVYPTQKSRRVARVAPGEGDGTATKILQPDRAEAMPAAFVERFTGRIRLVK